MLIAGIIFAGLALFLAVGATVLSPFCTPCVALFLGAGAGFTAGVIDKPTSDQALKKGAMAGAMGGLGAVLGQMIGAGVNAVIMGPGGAAELTGVAPSQEQAMGYWLGLVGGAICFSALDLILMAALGAVGCLLWQKLMGNNQPTAPSPV